MKIWSYILTLFVMNFSHAQTTTSDCLHEILYLNSFSKKQFLDCKDQLLMDVKNSNSIFLRLSSILASPAYKDFQDPIKYYDYIPYNYDYYDFEVIPQKVHRHRAILSIIKTHLQKNYVNDTLIIRKIKNEKDYSLTRLILHYNKNYTDRYIDFLYKEVFKDTTNYTIKQRKSLRRLAASSITKHQPEKYINRISKYILEHHEEEIYALVHHVFTDQRMIYLSGEIKRKLVDFLFGEVQKKEPSRAYSDIVAIEDLTSINFRKEVFDQIEYAKNKDLAEKLIHEKALKYFNENYKKQK